MNINSQRIGTLLKIQFCTPVIAFAFFLTACNSGVDEQKTDATKVKSDSIPSLVISTDSTAAIVKSIIDISVNDFYKNQQPLPLAFRNVRINYTIKPSKEVLYILCGEFTSKDKPTNTEWTHFTTIKNSDYEQWIGPGGLTYCEHSTELPYNKTDLSGELRGRLNSIEKIKK